MELAQLLAQMRRYEPGIPDARAQFEPLATFADQLQITKPKNVRAVFALPPRPNRSRRHWLHLVAVGRRFRTDYALIYELAKDLAPTVLNTGVVPIIDPLHDRDLTRMSVEQDRIVTILERGALLYENP